MRKSTIFATAWQSGRKPVGGKQFSAKEKHVPGEKMYYVRSENQVSNISVFKCTEVTSRKARNYIIYRIVWNIGDYRNRRK